MPEWTNGTVLKTVEAKPPWVRIPLPPLAQKITIWYGNIVKVCPKCSEDKPTKDFKNQPYCKNCRAVYNQERRQEAWRKLNRYKEFCRCKDCGNGDPRVLTFDPPQRVVSSAANGASWSKLYQVAAETDVVCANCLCIRQFYRSR